MKKIMFRGKLFDESYNPIRIDRVIPEKDKNIDFPGSFITTLGTNGNMANYVEIIDLLVKADILLREIECKSTFEISLNDEVLKNLQESIKKLEYCSEIIKSGTTYR